MSAWGSGLNQTFFGLNLMWKGNVTLPFVKKNVYNKTSAPPVIHGSALFLDYR